MKKITLFSFGIAFITIVAILILNLTASAQTTGKPGRGFSNIGVPTPGQRFNNFQPGYIDWCYDRSTGKKYDLISNVWTEDVKWNISSSAITGIGTVTTLAPGASATASIVGGLLNLGIPRGSTGATGATGGGSGSNWLSNVLTGPDKYFARHDSTTIAAAGFNQDSIDVKWPTSGATTAWTVDRAAWQEAANECTDNAKEIQAYGEYYVNGSITFEKYFRQAVVNGGGCKITATGTTNFAIFSRPSPADVSDANLMSGQNYGTTNFIFNNICLKGNPNSLTTGFNLGPAYLPRYDNVKIFDCDTAIMMRFQLAGFITNYEINNANSTNGRIGIWVGMGNWPGASNANSQSNSTVIISGRFYMVNNTSTAIKVHACSGVVISSVIIEGSVVMNGVEMDGNSSTVVKDITINHIHFECNPSGAINAAVKVRMSGGVANINGAFGQYASILADVGSTGGYVSAKISNVPYWVAKAGKSFNNAGGTSWNLDWCDVGNWNGGVGTVAAIPTMFSGTAVTLAPVGTMGYGNNKISQENLIPR